MPSSNRQRIRDSEVEGLVIVCSEFIYTLYGKKDRLYGYNCPVGKARSAFVNLVVESAEFGYVRRQLTDAQMDLIDSPGRGRYYRIQQAISRLVGMGRLVEYPVKVRIAVGRRDIEQDDVFYRPTNVLEQIALQADDS